jgi:hypothetical protein
MREWDIDYCEPGMRPLPDAPIVVVKAAMGCGKTKALKEFLKGRNALVVTFSRALAAKLVADFDGFVDYQVEDGYIKKDRVVVCLDSLWRIKTGRFDYVIIDEAVSVLLHFNSYLMQRASENVQVLDAYLHSSTGVYVVDAAVDMPFVAKFVERLESTKKQKATLVRNRFVRPTNRTVTIQDKPRGGVVYDTICSDVLNGKRVVVCSSTKQFVVTLAKVAGERCPSACVVVHHGSTGSEQLDDVATLWSTADLLIYSPSVTAGVSFELDHFDVLYANFVKSMYTPGVEISLQQLFRVRSLRQGTMTIWYSIMGGAAKTPESVDCPTFKGLNPKIQGGLDHTHPLGAIVANGVLEMKRRSDSRYKEVLIETLRDDHNIPIRVF